MAGAVAEEEGFLLLGVSQVGFDHDAGQTLLRFASLDANDADTDLNWHGSLQFQSRSLVGMLHGQSIGCVTTAT